MSWMRKKMLASKFFWLSHTKRKRRPNLFFFLLASPPPNLSRSSVESAQNGFLHQGPEMDHQPGHGELRDEKKRKRKCIDREEELPTGILLSFSTPTHHFFVRFSSLLIQVAGAGAVAGITAVKLQKVNVDAKGVSLGADCFLWDQTGSANPNQACIYAYTVSGVSLAAALALSLLQCFTCNLCGLGDWADALFEGAAAAWWGEYFFPFFQLFLPLFLLSKTLSKKMDRSLFFSFSPLFLLSRQCIKTNSSQASLQVREEDQKTRERPFVFFFVFVRAIGRATCEKRGGRKLGSLFPFLSLPPQNKKKASSPSTGPRQTPRASPRRSGARPWSGSRSGPAPRSPPAACCRSAGASCGAAAAAGTGDIKLLSLLSFFFVIIVLNWVRMFCNSTFFLLVEVFAEKGKRERNWSRLRFFFAEQENKENRR